MPKRIRPSIVALARGVAYAAIIGAGAALVAVTPVELNDLGPWAFPLAAGAVTVGRWLEGVADELKGQPDQDSLLGGRDRS